MALAAPRICCLDLDTFFVSVERLLDPRLIGKPVVVGGLPRQRGVVTASDYEVRALGVRSGMSLTRAYELAPKAVFYTRHGIYGDYALKVRRIAETYTPISQVASIDEMFLDFSGCESMYREADDANPDSTIERMVKKLTGEIKVRVGLPASAGIATSRSVAKVASGLAKPQGVLLVPAGTEMRLLGPLPVRKFPGIGPVAEQKLQARGLSTLADVATAPLAVLRRIFGAWAESIQRGCRGLGSHEIGRERPAFLEYDPDGSTIGTISNERTFREDVRDIGCIDRELCSLCERVCWRARKRGIKARTVTLKLRYADFQTLTRSRTITPTCSELELYPVVRELFDRARRRRLAIRLLGIALSNLGTYDEQLSLFDDGRTLYRAVDGVRKRYGYDALRIALTVSRRPIGLDYARPMAQGSLSWRAVALLGVTAVACAGSAQAPASGTEATTREAELPRAPIAPNRSVTDAAASPVVAPAATASTDGIATASAEPDTCPPPEATGSVSPRALALREPSADAVPPSPALLKKLSTAQKAELQFLSTFCETAVGTAAGRVEVGCSCCPPFDECGPVRGGRPRGNLDEVYRVVTRSEGSFSARGVQELALTFFGCEPHSSNWGGTMLYRRLKDGWSVKSYTSGIRPDRCQPYRLRESRDVLVCEWADAHQSIGHQQVFVYDFAAPDRKCWIELVDLVDDSSLCEGEPGKPLTWSTLDRVRFQDLNRDQILDLRVEGRSRSGVPSKRFQEVCMAKLTDDAAPTPAQLEAEHALLGPLKRLVFDFVSDGRHFTPR